MQDRPSQLSAGSLVLDLLTVNHQQSLETSAMCRAGHIFDLSEQNIRVTLTRLVKTGQVLKEQRGLYRLNPEFDTLTSDIIGWRSKAEATVKWQQGWIGVCDTNTPRSARTQWNRHLRALRRRGLRPSPSGLHLRPNNLKGGLAAIRHDLYGLGLSPQAMVLEIAPLAAEEQAMASKLWTADKLEHHYRRAIRQIQQSERRLQRAPREKAARETLLLGHALIRQTIGDPLLPDTLVDVRLRRRLVTELAQYQDHAVALWREILS